MMWGAIPKLKNAGLVETYKKPTTQWESKKTHFRKNTKKTKDITIIQFYFSSIFIRESDRT